MLGQCQQLQSCRLQGSKQAAKVQSSARNGLKQDPYHFQSNNPCIKQRRCLQNRLNIQGRVASSVGRTRTFEPQSLELNEKVGVLLLNLGGPEKLDDVQPFLYNLFADPDIIRLPKYLQFLQPLVAQIISSSRAPVSAEGYKSIGGGSPLRKITEEQGLALETFLQDRGVNASVYVAMRYWYPFTEEAMEQVKKDNVKKLVILPLYPQFSISTSGSSLRLLEQILNNDPAFTSLEHTVIPSWYNRAGYVGAMADLMEQELKQFDESRRNDAHVFFSAHGVPKSYVLEAGDPYKEEMESCVQLIMDEMKERGYGNPHTLAYQSRVGPVEWLQPYTDETLRNLGAQGVKDLLAIPVSFVSEHIETLEEMDMEYKEVAIESGITGWRRVPALNTNKKFIDDLGQAVIEALPFCGSVASASEALVPIGGVNSLLETYDQDRQTLPPPEQVWTWGWTSSAEKWNGRIAMVIVILIFLLEVTTGQSFFDPKPTFM